MDTSVSQKGTKTKARRATHSRLVAGAARCPECGCRHVLRTESSNGMRMGTHWCARCAAFFTVAA